MENVDFLIKKYKNLPDSAGRYKVLVEIGTIATPMEMVSLFDGMRRSEEACQEHNKNWNEWLSFEKSLFYGIAKPSVEPFVRVPLTDRATLFTLPNGHGSRQNLVVAITGNANRMMLPLHCFLQCFDALHTEIIMLDSRSLVEKGALDTAPSPSFFEAWVDDIAGHVADHGPYGHHAIMGTSFGALPALMAGIMLDFSNTLAVGPGSPYDRWWLDSGDFDPVEFLADRGRAHNTKISLAFGADSPEDHVSAGEIKDLADLTITNIAGADNTRIHHMCLHPLALAGILPRFLQMQLGLN